MLKNYWVIAISLYLTVAFQVGDLVVMFACLVIPTLFEEKARLRVDSLRLVPLCQKSGRKPYSLTRRKSGDYVLPPVRPSCSVTPTFFRARTFKLWCMIGTCTGMCKEISVFWYTPADLGGGVKVNVGAYHTGWLYRFDKYVLNNTKSRSKGSNCHENKWLAYR